MECQIMLSKRTIIGTIVGSAIIAIGAYSLVSDIGFQTINTDEILVIGESTKFQINSTQGGVQMLNVVGERFEITLNSPGDGLQIPTESFQREKYLEWTHMDDGITHLTIQNTGSTELKVTGTFEITTDPILFTYHFVVITSGVIIIGFSVGFTLRKPRGF